MRSKRSLRLFDGDRTFRVGRSARSGALAALVNVAARALLLAPGLTLSSPGVAQVSPDLVSRTALRVCSDPANPPFSDRDRTGFENKIADIVADQLKEPVRYLWAPSGPGFARNTLNADLCDIIMGYTIGSDVVQSTNPYYRSTYVLVTPARSALAGVRSLDDPRLKGHALGIFAATPPVDVMLAKGLMDKAKVYPLLVDHRYNSPLATMIGDLKSGTIEAAVVWGPLIGSDVKQSAGSLVMTPMLGDVDKPGFAYRITFGIRHDEPDWKHKLEAVIRVRQTDINKVLLDYDVPLIDDAGRTISSDEALHGTSVAGAAPRARRTPADSKMPGLVPQGFQMPGPAPSGSAAQP